jgi:hypothetical protein
MRMELSWTVAGTGQSLTQSADLWSPLKVSGSHVEPFLCKDNQPGSDPL